MAWKSSGLYNARWTESIFFLLYPLLLPSLEKTRADDRQRFILNGDDVPGGTTVLVFTSGIDTSYSFEAMDIFS